MICVSLTFELIQMSALIGPESAYGAVKGGVVNVAASASLGELSFSQFQPATSPAVHCVVEREQVPFSGIHGNVAVVSAASVTGASDPAYSELPLPGFAERYQRRYFVCDAGYLRSPTHLPAPR